MTGGQGTTTWTVVARSARHGGGDATLSGAVVTALATDWYAGFSGVPAGAQNLKVTYKGKNCGVTTAHHLHRRSPPTCRSRPSRSATGRSPARPAARTATSAGLGRRCRAPPAQPQGVGSTRRQLDLDAARPGERATSAPGSYAGQVRVLVHTQRWTRARPGRRSRPGATCMKIVYDAP